VVVPMTLVMLAFVAENETKKKISQLEEQMRPFPQAEAIKRNLSLTSSFVQWQTVVSAPRDANKPGRNPNLVEDAKRVEEVWFALSFAASAVKNTRDIADGKYGGALEVRLAITEDFLNSAKIDVARLKRLIGAENFRAGRMPPPVPYQYIKWN
jgi:hypothetical protein